MSFRTSNPVFNSYFWNNNKVKSEKMTINGIILKSVFCLMLTSLSIWYIFNLNNQGNSIKWWFYGGFIAAIFFSVLTSIKKRWAPVTVPIYAITKGLFLGGISIYAENRLDDVVFYAIVITIVTFFVMLILYKLKLVKVNKQFRSIIYTAIVSIMTVYIISFILSFFGVYVKVVYGNSWWAIGFTLIAACVAAFSLLLDFYYIERQLYKAPKYKEWLASWGILVSLFWLYVEVLRLLQKINFNR